MLYDWCQPYAKTVPLVTLMSLFVGDEAQGGRREIMVSTFAGLVVQSRFIMKDIFLLD